MSGEPDRPLKLAIYRETKPVRHGDEWRDDQLGWRWDVKSHNGRVLAESGEIYKSFPSCVASAGLVTGLFGDGVRKGDSMRLRDPVGRTWLVDVSR